MPTHIWLTTLNGGLPVEVEVDLESHTLESVRTTKAAAAEGFELFDDLSQANLDFLRDKALEDSQWFLRDPEE